MTIKFMAILQARMSSTRFPGKVLADLGGKPMIQYQLNRIHCSKLIESVVIATSDSKSDDPLVDLLESLGETVVRGDLNDVFSRFELAIDKFDPENFVRITGDCPLVMTNLIDDMIRVFSETPVDYFSNTLKPSFPDGLDLEIINSTAFKRASQLRLNQAEREHVTLAMYTRAGTFTTSNYSSGIDLSQHRWTVDYPEDLDFINSLVEEEQSAGRMFNTQDFLDFLLQNPQVRNSVSPGTRNIAVKRYLGRD
jgi:spore coat polysaccharide biosynthesis protein SpsF (cytidylyltransferase family)